MAQRVSILSLTRTSLMEHGAKFKALGTASVLEVEDSGTGSTADMDRHARRFSWVYSCARVVHIRGAKERPLRKVCEPSNIPLLLLPGILRSCESNLRTEDLRGPCGNPNLGSILTNGRVWVRATVPHAFLACSASSLVITPWAGRLRETVNTKLRGPNV